MRREEDSSRIPSVADEEKEESGSFISGSITRSTMPRTSGNLTSVHFALMSSRRGTLPMYLPIVGGRTEGIY